MNKLLIVKQNKNGELSVKDSQIYKSRFVFCVKGDKVFVVKQYEMLFDKDVYPISELKSMKRKVMGLQPNTVALNSLKSQGYKVIVNHCRRVCMYDSIEEKWEIKLIPDFEWRAAYFKNGFYKLPEEKGGATILTLIRGEEKIVVRADCYIKDRFARRLGVAACLKKLESLYGIK